MKKSILLAIFTAIALIASAQKNAVELRLNLEKGKTYTQTATINMNMKMDMMGTKIDANIPMGMTISMKVVDIKNDTIVMETTYDAIKMNFNILGQEMKFDSSDKNQDPENLFAQIFSSFIGKPFTVILDNRQNIIAIEGLNKLIASMLENEAFDEEQREEMNTMLQGILGEEKMRENFSSSNMVFPKEPVYKGFSWTTETAKNVQGIDMQIKNTHTVKKITAKDVEISLISEYAMAATSTENELPIQITMEKGQVTGTYIIDLQSGWTKSAKSNTVMKMLMTAGEVSIPMQITMEMIMK
ncbi:MAG: DUF6263 family protein [Bacteroidetes bacterium]|nr:DUF6263 family protein [Bacteroidota bacterium]MCL2329317.1 DUF6263 family protein [Bacteroidota bacterium]